MCQTRQGGEKIYVVKESVDYEEGGNEEYFRINVIKTYERKNGSNM
jgi:hypothetical protein